VSSEQSSEIHPVKPLQPGTIWSPQGGIPRITTIVLALLAGWLMWPFAGWVVLAVWLSGFARPLHTRIARWLHGRANLAAFVTVALMMMVLIPLGAVVTMLVIDAVALVTELAQSDRMHSVLVSLVSEKNPKPDASISDLLLMQSERALGLAMMIFSSAAQLIIGLFVLLAGIYAMLVEGRRWYAWAEDHLPIGPQAWHRFSAAFVETGRGLAFGVIGAGVLQSILATAAYLVLGVPQALPLGLLTLIFSIVPVIGTAIVWAPVAAGLAITGRMVEGIGLAIFGVVVIGSIDNIARPWLTRYGKLQLPPFVVLVAMFGAVEIFGGWGILFGPLIVRLAKEALEVRREAVHD
jgi:predicted PurR-regulated permease PerM